MGFSVAEKRFLFIINPPRTISYNLLTYKFQSYQETFVFSNSFILYRLN